MAGVGEGESWLQGGLAGWLVGAAGEGRAGEEAGGDKLVANHRALV